MENSEPVDGNGQSDFFLNVQARLERKLVSSTLQRREELRIEHITSRPLPLFGFEKDRAFLRKQERRMDERDMLLQASGHGRLSLTPKFARKRHHRVISFSVRSWKQMSSEKQQYSKAKHELLEVDEGIEKEERNEEDEKDSEAVGDVRDAAGLSAITEAGGDEDKEVRARIHRNRRVRQLADVFWETVPRDRQFGVLKKDFLSMYTRILKTLYESFEADKAKPLARRTWEQSCPKGVTSALAKEPFRYALLTTADTWAHQASVDAYIEFFSTLFARIAEPLPAGEPGEFRFMELEKVSTSIDETKNEILQEDLPDYVSLIRSRHKSKRATKPREPKKIQRFSSEAKSRQRPQPESSLGPSDKSEAVSGLPRRSIDDLDLHQLERKLKNKPETKQDPDEVAETTSVVLPPLSVTAAQPQPRRYIPKSRSRTAARKKSVDDFGVSPIREALSALEMKSAAAASGASAARVRVKKPRVYTGRPTKLDATRFRKAHRKSIDDIGLDYRGTNRHVNPSEPQQPKGKAFFPLIKIAPFNEQDMF